MIALVPPSCCGAGYFRRLRRALPDDVGVRALELPGHGRRHAQDFVTSAPAVVADALAQLGGRVDVVYGESLGAYVALGLVAALGDGPGTSLVAASNVPPARQRAVTAQDVATPSAAAATLAAMGGVLPDEVLGDPALLAQVFPVIRADLLLSRSLVAAVAATAVAGDLTVVAGEDDRALSGLAGWARHTTGRCSFELLPGGHLLSQSNPTAVAGVLLSVLSGR
ncbi:thioesterase II family protein [Streptomyces sp. NPDC049813]|uniref:thioesterase II family protein n=1 Tax=Streptomyces sp. NPDC049813 TaxID=3365597 RepID=UPI0037B130AC